MPMPHTLLAVCRQLIFMPWLADTLLNCFSLIFITSCT